MCLHDRTGDALRDARNLMLVRIEKRPIGGVGPNESDLAASVGRSSSVVRLQRRRW